MNEKELNYSAITINISVINKYNLKSIDSVYDFLINQGIRSLLISSERTEGNYNIHYHVLAEEIGDVLKDLLWKYNIYNEQVRNEFDYVNYIIKDGNYKIYNGYELPLYSKKKDDITNLLNDIYIYNLDIEQLRIKYPKLYLRYYSTIKNMIIGK